MEEVRIGIGRLTGKRVNPLEERAGLVFGGRGRLLGVLGGEFDLGAVYDTRLAVLITI